MASLKSQQIAPMLNQSRSSFKPKAPQAGSGHVSFQPDDEGTAQKASAAPEREPSQNYNIQQPPSIQLTPQASQPATPQKQFSTAPSPRPILAPAQAPEPPKPPVSAPPPNFKDLMRNKLKHLLSVTQKQSPAPPPRLQPAQDHAQQPSFDNPMLKQMGDGKLYDEAIGMIDEQMNDLRKKKLREMLIFKAH